MSLASAQRTIRFTTHGGTYTAHLIAPQGDIYQEYSGTESAPRAPYIPDFATLATKPLIQLVVTSSRATEVAEPDGVEWYFNGELIRFPQSPYDVANLASPTIPAGTFFRSTNVGYPCILITGNIAPIAHYAPATIAAQATLTYGTMQDTIQAQCAIPISLSRGSSYKVTIASADNKAMVLHSSTDECQLRALTYLAGALDNPSNFTYQWSRWGTNATHAIPTWLPLGTAQNQTINASMVDSQLIVRVEVSHATGSHALVGADTQVVIDASDPWEIDPNPNPADETIVQGDSVRNSVTYRPILHRRGKEAAAEQPSGGHIWYFSAFAPSGMPLTIGPGGEEYISISASTLQADPSEGFTITSAHCAQAGGDVAIVISAE